MCVSMCVNMCLCVLCVSPDNIVRQKKLRLCVTQKRSRIGCVVYGYLKMSVKKYVIKSKNAAYTCLLNPIFLILRWSGS